MRGIASIRVFMRFWSPEAIANRKTPGALAAMVVPMATYRSVGGSKAKAIDDGGELPFVLVLNIETACVMGAKSGSLAKVGSMT
jgi:hypothetical protein